MTTPSTSSPDRLQLHPDVLTVLGIVGDESLTKWKEYRQAQAQDETWVASVSLIEFEVLLRVFESILDKLRGGLKDAGFRPGQFYAYDGRAWRIDAVQTDLEDDAGVLLLLARRDEPPIWIRALPRG